MTTTGKNGWKKSAILYGKPGYYEVTEDTAWSWKYDLRRIELSDAIAGWPTDTSAGTVFDGTGSDTINCSKPSDTEVTQQIALATEKFGEASTGVGVEFSFGEKIEYTWKCGK